jgi:Mrp family chromosome partitioning ATPase
MVGLEDSAHPTNTDSILKVINMGRTLDILKHTRASPVSLKIAPQLPQASRPAILPLSEGTEEVPFVEVGGPNHELQGSAAVLAHPASRLKVSDGKSSSEKQNRGDAGTGITNLDPASSILDLPLSVVFQPLGSFHCIETATGLIAPELVVYHQPDQSVSQEFRVAASGIQQQLASGGTHVLLFTAVSARAGTTTTVLNLAFVWAKHERRKVLVVDVADARAAVAAKMGLSNTPGLSDVIKGTVPLAQALQETKQPNCWVLAAGVTVGEPAAAPQPKAMRDLLRQARKQFDLILLDALPWNDDPATIALASGADGVYLVLRHAESKTPKVDDIIKRIQRHDIFLGGCVITHRKKD